MKYNWQWKQNNRCKKYMIRGDTTDNIKIRVDMINI